MKKALLPLLCLCVLLCSCGNKSEKDIEDTMAKGVVLVQNQSYYELVLSNGTQLFFTNFDEENRIQGLETDEDSVEVALSFGTGFFVSETGEIATNAHVVSNMIADKQVNKSVANVLEQLKTYVQYQYQEEYGEWQTLYEAAQQSCVEGFYNDFVSAEEYHQRCAVRDAIQEKMEETTERYSQIYRSIDDIRASDTEIKYHNRVSVAYNNTFVTQSNDFVSCVVTKTDAEHDLAILQLKDKKTPEDKYVFEVPEDDPLEDYSLGENLTAKMGTDKNSKLFMCGFNLGPSLALTKEGVKSQFNNGTISQRTSEKLMYSIPALHGSSGSPVVNFAGQLVAINFAGIDTTQNFNYGVRVKYLRKLLQE